MFTVYRPVKIPPPARVLCLSWLQALSSYEVKENVTKPKSSTCKIHGTVICRGKTTYAHRLQTKIGFFFSTAAAIASMFPARLNFTALLTPPLWCIQVHFVNYEKVLSTEPISFHFLVGLCSKSFPGLVHFFSP